MYIDESQAKKKVFRGKSMVLAVVLFTIGALFIPTGFERTHPGERVKVEVLSTNDANIRQFGIVKTGEQSLKVRVLSGEKKGVEAEAVNLMMGRLEFDRVYQAGDIALATIDSSGDRVLQVTLVDYYRVDKEAWLLVIFAVLLVAYGGWTGARSLLSFLFTAMLLWKVLLPGLLKGWDPVLSSLLISAILCVVIILLVSGIDRRGITAMLGSLAGVAVTCVMGVIFGELFSVHGAVKPFSETLLYSGFAHLDLTRIFLGGIFLASSGAVMDLAMDISSALNELIEKRPDIPRGELIRSGMTVGRMVIGTMTTTLLLAYTGGFTTLLMVFIAQGTPIINILNIQYVAAEVLHTMVGSIGLVTVAPLTAVLGGYFLTAGRKLPHGSEVEPAGAD